MSNVAVQNEIERRVAERMEAETARIRKQVEEEELRKIEKAAEAAKKEAAAAAVRLRKNLVVDNTFTKILQELAYTPERFNDYTSDAWYSSYTLYCAGGVQVNAEYYRPYSNYHYTGEEYLRMQVYGDMDNKSGWMRAGKNGFDAKKIAAKVLEIKLVVEAQERRRNEKQNIEHAQKDSFRKSYEAMQAAGLKREEEELYEFETYYRVKPSTSTSVKVSKNSTIACTVELTCNYEKLEALLRLIGKELG